MLAQALSNPSFEKGHVELATAQYPAGDDYQSKPDPSNGELYRKLQYTPQQVKSLGFLNVNAD